MKIPSIIPCLLSAGTLLSTAFTAISQPVDGPGRVVTAAQRDAHAADWRAKRFGMFIHWGPVSLRGTEIGWSRAGERRDRKETVRKGIPAAEYDSLYKQFNPYKFNADQWVAIAKSAGMRYIVLTAKHHDGFCMFDSKLTDYKITNTPFKRDVTAELATACRKAGIGFGLYYSPPDWHHPDFCTPNHARYIEYLHGQVKEISTNYGPLVSIWFDRTAGVNTAETWDNPRLFKMIRTLQPHAMITTRCGGLPHGGVWGDFDSPEQRVGGFQMDPPWETCMTICRQWAWKPNDQMKSLEQCLGALITSAGGDGNLLFNVGPTPEGEIEARQVERLKEMGAWLKDHGESIYGTRGGPYLPGKSYVTTRKGNHIYLHILKWPKGGIQLPPLPAKILRSSLLADPGKPVVTQTAQGVTVSVDVAEGRQPINTVVKLELSESALALAPIPPLPTESAKTKKK